MNSVPRFIAASYFVFTLALVGCGETRTDLGTVSGTISLDGKNLEDAQVEFAPTSAEGTTSYGKTDSNGRYSMTMSRDVEGAALGNNVVRITTADVIEQDGEEVVVKEKLPAKYNTNSELTADVQPGANAFDFQLETGSKEIRQPKLTDD